MGLDRLREKNKIGEFFSLPLFAYSLPQQSILYADALCVFSGLGEHERISMPIKQYWDNPASISRFFLIAGHNKKEKMWQHLSAEVLSEPPFNVKKLDGLIIQQEALHTKEQAEWLTTKIKEYNITSCVLFASSFHTIRAYLTVLSEFEHANIRIPLIPVSIPKAPGVVIPEMNENAWSMAQGELDRIILYQEKGHVLSYEEFREYIDWLWKQPIIKNNI